MNTNIEFSDGSTTGWNDHGSTIYCFNEEKEAQKHIWKRKQEEVKKYREWIQREQKIRGCFIHHFYEIKVLDVF